MKIKAGKLLGREVMALALLSLAGVSLYAQGPDSGPPDMGPHRPPMERAMGPGGPGGPGMRGDRGRWWNDPKAIEKFKFTESQRKTMDEIYQQHKLNLIDMHAALEKQEVAMEPLMGADQPDEGKILSQIDRVAAARAELEKANARMLLGIRKELTPEQWKLIQADRAARRDNPAAARDRIREHRNWHGPAGSGGPGMKSPDTQSGPPPAGGAEADGPRPGGPSEEE